MTHPREVEDKAAHWVMRREEPEWSAADESDLSSWLDESDMHKVAFWRLDHGWRQADRIGSIGVSTHVRGGTRQFTRSWLRPALAIAASLAIFFAAFALQVGLPIGSEARIEMAEFTTDVGGRKTVSFADGSRVELNTATAIRAAVGPDEREVWLERGEAYFEVAERTRDRFIVHAGDKSVSVLGTKFSVRRSGSKVTVAVLDGRVRLSKPNGDPIILSTGEVAVSDTSLTEVSGDALAEIQRQLAWRGGTLVFDDVPLATAAAEFNRYNRKQLIIADQQAARLRIGGSFQTTNVEAFSRLLENAYGLRVHASGDRITVSS